MKHRNQLKCNRSEPSCKGGQQTLKVSNGPKVLSPRIYRDTHLFTDALELCYQQYVKRDGPKAVNISEQMIAEITTQRDEKSWTSETFVKAQEEVYFIMARDVHPRFVNSKLFSNLVQCLGGFLENGSQDNVSSGVLESDERDILRATLVNNEMLTQFKRKDTLYRRFSDLCGPTADEAAKLSQVGLSPSDLKLSTRRSQRGSSMFSAASFSSIRSLRKSTISLASKQSAKSNTSSIGSLQTVKSTGDVLEKDNDNFGSLNERYRHDIGEH